MPKYKNIRIKKRGGGTRLQRVQVLASGKYKFVKNLSKGRTTKKKKSGSSKPKKKVYKTAKNKKRRKPSMTISIPVAASIIGALARPAPRGDSILQAAMNGDWNGVAYNVREIFAGVDLNGKIRPEWLVATYGPMVIAGLVHKYVGGKPLNLNRYLRGVPFIRI